MLLNKKQIMDLVRSIAGALVNLHIIDYDKIPQSGAFILTTGHISRLDTPLLMISTPRQDVIAMVARDYQKNSFFKWILNTTGVIWMSRNEMDFTAFRKAIDYLRKGWVVGIAPEGTRSRDQKLQVGKLGAALLVDKTKVPIVPVSITGSADLLANLIRFRKTPVEVRYGEAYYLPEMNKNNRKAWLEQSRDEIMCRIAALLPEANRGYYANHPRLIELLAEQ